MGIGLKESEGKTVGGYDASIQQAEKQRRRSRPARANNVNLTPA
jgi:hypothetical protein